MAKIIWDDVGQKVYEAGVNHGVFYNEEGLGVPWNGLVSIDEDIQDESEPVYFDGVKVDEIVTVGGFFGTMTAFTYPDEFQVCQGIAEHVYGYQLPEQPYSRFGLSYQTGVGSDSLALGTNYKIHILYNVTAVPSQRGYQTISDDVEAIEFEWDISALPEEIPNYRPTSHLIFDSRKMNPTVMTKIQELIYGTDLVDPYLPPMGRFLKMISDWMLTPP